MTVLITNALPDDNRGGCALTLAAIEFARQSHPHAKVALVAVREDADVRRSFRHTLRREPDVSLLPPLVDTKGTMPAVALALLSSVAALITGRSFGRVRRETLDALRHAELVISRGGVVYNERTPTFRDALRLWFTSFPTRIAIRFGRPVVLLGAQVSPFVRGPSRWVVGSVLRRADLVNVRGSTSETNSARLRVRPENMTRSPDSVFLLTTTDADIAEASRLLRARGIYGQRFAAMTARSTYRDAATAESIDFMIRIGESLKANDLIDCFVVTLQVDGAAGSDRDACLQLAGGLEELSLPVVTLFDDLDPLVLAGVYGAAQAVLSTRMHSAILGLIGGTPSFPVVCGDGTRKREVYGEANLDRWVVQHPEDIEAVTQAVQNGRAERQALRKLVGGLREEALATVGALGPGRAPWSGGK